MTAICRIRLRDAAQTLVHLDSIDNTSQISDEARLQWTKSILKDVCTPTVAHEHEHISDLDLVLCLDGSVVNIAENASLLPETSTSQLTHEHADRYPGHYQLPKTILARLDGQEKVRRQELFAIGCLLYELSSSKKPFHDMSTTEVQLLYDKGIFPADVWAMPTAVSILCCWCPEFALEIRGTFLQRMNRHVVEHPILFTCQAVGALGAITACVALPILGAVGFAATGPVAGTAAAAWQAGIGLVEAGSVFAWCQSAAMGGAAVGGIIATGVSGATVIAGATALQMLDSSKTDIPPSVLEEKFLSTWKRQIP